VYGFQGDQVILWCYPKLKKSRKGNDGDMLLSIVSVQRAAPGKISRLKASPLTLSNDTSEPSGENSRE
jgi:hypothetical protein